MGFAEKLRKGVVPASESFQVTTLQASSQRRSGTASAAAQRPVAACGLSRYKGAAIWTRGY